MQSDQKVAEKIFTVQKTPVHFASDNDLRFVLNMLVNQFSTRHVHDDRDGFHLHFNSYIWMLGSSWNTNSPHRDLNVLQSVYGHKHDMAIKIQEIYHIQKGTLSHYDFCMANICSQLAQLHKWNILKIKIWKTRRYKFLFNSRAALPQWPNLYCA